ncbi:O-antigen ligase family protein [Candidatus Daviesbacteria bacterium]|nr:O-antigen ligase family protein [Candidatus Daviesbacteria bacterium]
MPELIISFLLFFLPLIILPFGISPFEIPKVIIAEISIQALLVCFLLFSKKIEVKNFNPLFLVISLGFLILSIIHLLFFNQPTTFFGNSFRLQGVFLLWNLIILSLISSQFKLKTLPSYIFFGLILFELLASLAISPNLNNRAIGTLGEPNALASFLIFLWPFLLFNAKKSLKIIGSLLVLGLVILTGSRSGLIGLGIEGIFYLLIRLSKLKQNLVVLLSFVLIILSLVLPFLEGFKVYESRKEIWQTSLTAGAISPILGWGFGNTQIAISQTSKILGNNVQYQFVDSSHNFLLDFWLQAGVVGLVLVILLILQVIQNLIKNKKALEIMALLGVIIVMLFNPVSIVTLIAFWWLIGQGFV